MLFLKESADLVNIIELLDILIVSLSAEGLVNDILGHEITQEGVHTK